LPASTRIEAAQRELARKLADIDELFFLVSAQRRCLVANAKASAVLGRAVREIIDRPLLDLVPTLAGTPFEKVLREVILEREQRCLSFEFEPWGGELECRFYPVPDGSVALTVSNSPAQNTSFKEQLVAEVVGIRRIHALSMRSATDEPAVHQLMHQVVDAAMDFAGATLATLQTFDPHAGALKLRAQRSFDRGFCQSFDNLQPGEPALLYDAYRTGTRVVIEDIARSSLLGKSDWLRALLDAGVRAMQSTPVVGLSGRVLGVLSTYHQQPGRPTEQQLCLIDLLACQLANVITFEQARQPRSSALLNRLHRASVEFRRSRVDFAATAERFRKLSAQFVMADLELAVTVLSRRGLERETHRAARYVAAASRSYAAATRLRDSGKLTPDQIARVEKSLALLRERLAAPGAPPDSI
jgi:GAF domain-containing protein